MAKDGQQGMKEPRGAGWRGIRFLELGAILLSLVGSSLTASGFPSVSPFDLGYATRLWTVADGLPSNHINSITQGEDGYLWVGTEEGLVRFDGHRFSVPEGIGPPGSVEHLSLDSSGKLWVCFYEPRIGCYDGERWEFLDRRDGVRFGWKRLVESADGRHLVVTNAYGSADAGLFVGTIDDGRYADYRAGGDHGPVTGLVAGDDGEFWGNATDLFRIDDDEGFRWAGDSGQRVASGGLSRLANGGLIGAFPDGIHTLEHGRWVLAHPSEERLPENLREGAEDADGTLWFGSYADGLSVHIPDIGYRRVFPARYRIARTCSSVFVDREGSVWVGSSIGLFQFVKRAFLPWPAQDPFSNAVVHALAEGDEGTIWAAGTNQLYSWSAIEGFRAIPSVRPSDEFELIAPANSGGVWVACSALPLWHFDGREFRVVIGEGDDFRKGILRGLLECHEGSLWLLTGETLFRMPRGAVAPVPADLVADITAIVPDGEGSVLAASRSLGPIRWSHGEWKQLAPSLGGEFVLHQLSAHEGGVWMVMEKTIGEGSNFYLGYADRRGVVSAPMDWLAHNTQMVTGTGGTLWFHPPRGSVRMISADAAEAFLRGGTTDEPLPSRRFDTWDGLVSTRSRQAPGSVLATRDGRVWFASELGVSVHQATAEEAGLSMPDTPPIVIERVRIDQRPVSYSRAGSIPAEVAVAASAKTLDFSFRALGFREPGNMRYRFRLEGFDEDWSEPGPVGQAIYRNLPPGDYRFRVTAANRVSGEPLDWNPSAASLTIRVEPRWFQRPLTRAAVAVLALGMVGIIFLVRDRMLRAESLQREAFSRELIASQEAERSRVAGELHDSLGQDLLVIKARVDLGDSTNGEVSAGLRDAITQIKQLSRELRPVLLERLGLGASLESMAEEVSAATRIPIVCDIDPDVGVGLSGEAQMSVFRMMQEALNNIVSHAEASEVKMQATCQGKWTWLRVEDDGRGFDQSEIELKAGQGFGLRGMDERASLLGGEFRCDSAPGQGCRIEAKIPRSPARL